MTTLASPLVSPAGLIVSRDRDAANPCPPGPRMDWAKRRWLFCRACFWPRRGGIGVWTSAVAGDGDVQPDDPRDPDRHRLP